MEKNIIEENTKSILSKILNEEVSKVSRQEFNRVLFKLEELDNSLTETIKEYKKLEESLPYGLKNVTNKKMSLVKSYLYATRNDIAQLVSNVRKFRKRNSEQIDEKKK